MTTLTIPSLEIAGGSVLGADHQRTGRGNQDAWVVCRPEGAVVAVVADGCGSGKRSEVGAVIGSRLFAQAVADELEADASPDEAGFYRRVRERVGSDLRALLERMAGPASAIVSECLLFTVVCAVVTERVTAVAAVGDGLVVVNGAARELGPFENNQPPYLGYDLLRRDGVAPPDSDLVLVVPSDELETLVIGTDGATALVGEDLDALTADHLSFRNPDGLRRRLARLNRGSMTVDWEAQRVVRSSGPLSDDTTLVMIRRGA